MCGIVGFVSEKNCLEEIKGGLEKLEYRGYDSAGVAFFSKGKISTLKKKGRVSSLFPLLQGKTSNCGIGHTRWATHGAPSDINAHPHRCGKFVIVHNGIIENYGELKKELEKKDKYPLSETDSEIIAMLLDNCYKGDVVEAVREVVKKLKGAFAVAGLCEDFVGKIFLFKRENPLIVGRGEGFFCFASDSPALISHTALLCKMKDGDICEIDKTQAIFYEEKGKIVERVFMPSSLKSDSANKGDFQSFMLKEIYDIPKAIKNTLCKFEKIGLSSLAQKKLRNANHFLFLGCGSAYHACVYGKYLTEKITPLCASAETAGEYRYRRSNLPKNTVVVAVSQSGETADTVTAVKKAKSEGAFVIAITNVPSSTITTFAHESLVTLAEVEIAVAATKSYNTQLVALYWLVSEVALMHKKATYGAGYLGEKLRSAIIKTLDVAEETHRIAKRYLGISKVFFLGKNFDYATALEGALKMKEISYIQVEGIPSGEIKHGPLALIDENCLVVHIITDYALLDKCLNVVEEVSARGGETLIITSLNLPDKGVKVVKIPKLDAELMPIVSVIPTQFLAYFMAIEMGLDADKPRNLAKSVTVE